GRRAHDDERRPGAAELRDDGFLALAEAVVELAEPEEEVGEVGQELAPEERAEQPVDDCRGAHQEAAEHAALLVRRGEPLHALAGEGPRQQATLPPCYGVRNHSMILRSRSRESRPGASRKSSAFFTGGVSRTMRS